MDELTTVQDLEEENVRLFAGLFRGIAASVRSAIPAFKAGVRVLGQARPLAFASEGAVAGQSLIPKAVYYGAWGLSGVAVLADISTRVMDAPPEKQLNTGIYYTSFHIPASIVLPAVIIHQVVHLTEKIVAKPTVNLPPRAKVYAPVIVALLSVIPVVPIVDHACEIAMEPTLGKMLGLEFHGHGSNEHASDKKEK